MKIKQGKEKVDLLLVGPLPPPIGGTTIAFQNLVEEVANNYSGTLRVFAIHSNKTIIGELTQLLKLLYQSYNASTLLIHAPTSRIIVWAPVLYVFTKIMTKKIQYRFFGSDLDLIYTDSTIARQIFKLIKYADSILVETKGLYDFVTTRISEQNVHWFPNSSKDSLIRDVEKNDQKNKLTLVYAGHVKNEKGIPTLLQAMDHLIAYKDIRLTIVGSCKDSALLQNMERLDNVDYRGELPHAQVQEILTQSHVFVFPTIWQAEGYPGAVIEAMMHGLPIIATQWRFMHELVVQNCNGILITPEDKSSLCKAIIKIHTDRQLLCRYGHKSVEMASTLRSSYWNAEKYISLIPGV